MDLTLHRLPQPLEQFVKAIIVFESKADVPVNSFYPLGDQFLLITVEGSINLSNRKKGSFVLPSISMNGQSTTSMKARLVFPASIFAVQFRPFGCYALFGQVMSKMVDWYIDCSNMEYEGDLLIDRLRSLDNKEAKLELLTRFLLHRLAISQTLDIGHVARAVDMMEAASGKLRILEITKMIPTTERTLERNFLRMVGISPKTYSRICRFNHVMQLLVSDSKDVVYEIIRDYGSFDSSHFIRDFVSFTGCSPTVFKKDSTRFNLNRQHLIELYSMAN